MNKEKRIVVIQIILFISTFITTTLAGAEWTFGKSIIVYAEEGIFLNTAFLWSDFASGLHFSIPFLLILTVHEFGHYFTAMHHKVKSSLPYYIPLPPLPLSIGTMGAVIRLRSKIYSKMQNFDIGIAGPLAGFVMAFIVLVYGFATLPPAEYIFQIHPEYEQYGLNYADHVYKSQEGVIDVTIGKNLLFMFFEQVSDQSRVPNVHEVMHYPYLFAGFLALVFTSLNLLPIGQLDGGHVVYGLVGYKKHRWVASIFFVGFLFYSGLGMLPPGEHLELVSGLFNFLSINLDTTALHYASIIFLIYFYYVCLRGLRLSGRDTWLITIVIFGLQYALVIILPSWKGYSGWLLFGFLLGRFLGITHPPSEIEEPLDDNRKILGWIAVIIFIICFTPNPIQLNEM